MNSKCVLVGDDDDSSVKIVISGESSKSLVEISITACLSRISQFRGVVRVKQVSSLMEIFFLPRVSTAFNHRSTVAPFTQHKYIWMRDWRAWNWTRNVRYMVETVMWIEDKARRVARADRNYQICIRFPADRYTLVSIDKQEHPVSPSRLIQAPMCRLNYRPRKWIAGGGYTWKCDVACLASCRYVKLAKRHVPATPCSWRLLLLSKLTK